MRYLYGVTRIDRCRNAAIREDLQVYPLLLRIEIHAPIIWLRFEATQNTFVKTSSIRMSGRKRPRGRPRQGWLRRVKANEPRTDW
ncbi:UNVERIFIED_CONTAM: hypothetical protein PYX00_006899 [Menopon gallinae]|uniref:Uncharacterized protein n=1 Tax=Menopon gallinae TaxID=328185 RepID=A0AAW2HX18_9NEOP